VRHAPQKVDAVGDALGRGLLFEGVLERAVADEGELEGAAATAQQPRGRDQLAQPLALDEVADAEHERLVGQVVVRRLDGAAEARRAVEHHVQALLGYHISKQSRDGARIGHHGAGGAEHGARAGRGGAAGAEMLVHVGAVDRDDEGHAQVGGQPLGERAVGQRLVGVHQVVAAALQRRQRADLAVGQVAEAVEEQAPRRLQHARVLRRHAIARGRQRLLAARLQPRVPPQHARRVRRRREHARLHSQLTQRQDLLVHEEVSLDARGRVEVRDDEDLQARASAAASRARLTTASPSPYMTHIGAKPTELLGPSDPTVKPISASSVPPAR
jgi:hypothetical protein